MSEPEYVSPRGPRLPSIPLGPSQFVHMKKDESPLISQVGGNHYSKLAIQPVEFIHANQLNFLEGCIVKRICRHRSKNGKQDLEKIIHEVQLLIEMEYPEHE